MIRRDIRLPSGAAGWMLISQIEHARVSAELAAHCTVALGAAVRDDVFAAVLHHDDGWAGWERSPRLDDKLGRPLSFTEIDPADAIEIWSDSIAAAERAAGSLAAWLVAGHFARLAERSEDARASPELVAWRLQIGEKRARWLATWISRDPRTHTAEAAAAALPWVWTFDEISLWLCCTCQPDRPIPCAPEPYRAGHDTPIEMELELAAASEATITPWRFAPNIIELAVEGRAVPAARYATAAKLLAAAVPQRLTWRLSRPEPRRE
jgi:hypothetical protein